MWWSEWSYKTCVVFYCGWQFKKFKAIALRDSIFSSLFFFEVCIFLLLMSGLPKKREREGFETLPPIPPQTPSLRFAEPGTDFRVRQKSNLRLQTWEFSRRGHTDPFKISVSLLWDGDNKCLSHRAIKRSEEICKNIGLFSQLPLVPQRRKANLAHGLQKFYLLRREKDIRKWPHRGS